MSSYVATFTEEVNFNLPTNTIRDLKKISKKDFQTLTRKSDIVQFRNPLDWSVDDVPVVIQLELIY